MHVSEGNTVSSQRGTKQVFKNVEKQIDQVTRTKLLTGQASVKVTTHSKARGTHSDRSKSHSHSIKPSHPHLSP